MDPGRSRGTSGRQALHQFVVTITVTQTGLGRSAHQLFDPFGLHRAGADPDHANAIVHRCAAQCAGKGIECSIAGGACDIIGIHPFSRSADHVDDRAAVSLLHQRVKGAGEIDIAHDFEIPGGPPAGIIYGFKRAAGNVTGVVDQDVGIGCCTDQPVDLCWFPQVARNCGGDNSVRACQFAAEGFQLCATSGCQGQIAAFAATRRTIAASSPGSGP